MVRPLYLPVLMSSVPQVHLLLGLVHAIPIKTREEDEGLSPIKHATGPPSSGPCSSRSSPSVPGRMFPS